jgi:flagellar motor switch protein FliG
VSFALDIPRNRDALPDLPSFGGGTGGLTKRQKAAIVVRVLLAEGARISLDDLPDALQEELARQMSEMRFVDRSTLASVVEEFLGEIEEIGISFPGGLEGALAMLDGTISAATASRLRKQAGLAFCGNPWERIGDIDTARLVELMTRESIEVSAIVLSKLKVAKAAEVLGKLPGDRARRITYGVSLTGAIAPATVQKIGLALLQQLDARPPTAFDQGPVERVGAILNFSPSATRDDVLAGLDEDDAGFAAEVRKAIFTFANIPTRVSPRDVPKIMREVPQAALATVIAGGSGPVAKAAEFILENMSKRLGDTIREEAEGMQVKAKDVEEAANEVVSRIRQMEAEGQIFLTAEEEEEG